MQTEISDEAAVTILSEAFLPLHCGAETFDYRFVRFRVFDENDDGLIRMEKLTPTQYGSPQALQSIIEHARSKLSHRGYTLHPWQMPDIN